MIKYSRKLRLSLRRTARRLIVRLGKGCMLTLKTAPLSSMMTMLVFLCGMIPSAIAQSPFVNFGPISVPGTSVVFDPNSVLAAATLAGLMGGDGNHSPTPAVQALAFPAAAGQVFTFAASRTVTFNYNIGSDTVGPDGGAGKDAIASLGSISGFSAPAVFPLVGVFTKAGDAIVLYGVGFGPVSPNTPAGQIVQKANSLALSLEISIGGVAVTPACLAPNYTGLYQFNITIPSGVSGVAPPLMFRLDGYAAAQTLSLAVTD